MYDLYTYGEDKTDPLGRFIEILTVKHLGGGRYVLKGRERREDYEDQLKLDGFTLLGFVYNNRSINKPEIHAFFIPEQSKTGIYILKYNGSWIKHPIGDGRKIQNFTQEGQPEPISKRQYRTWQKLKTFRERVTLKIASTEAEIVNSFARSGKA